VDSYYEYSSVLFGVKQKARKPDFELTKPSTGQDYNNELLGLPAYKTAK
jgi:hypothetical protein